ncbi:phage protein [Escherichia coli]|nr:phage protein [Escherichia coli]
MKTPSVSTISGAAIGRWPYILSALGIKVPSAGHHGACPACGGKDRFRLDDKRGEGRGFVISAVMAMVLIWFVW